MSGRRARADAARAIPLPDVAARLGYRKDPADGTRWKRPGSVISIDGPKFHDHVRGRGGGGAIDLVIHAEGCGFHEALRRLEEIASPGLPEGRAWERVRRRLLLHRGLDPELIGHARRIGVLGADGRANAVFACRDRDGVRTGAELVGTLPGRPFKGMARGSRKAAGGFWISRRPAPETALLVEGAVDALSAWTLDEGARIDIVISTAGVAARMPEWIGGLGLRTVLCGYDADPAGDRAARCLETHDPKVRRMRPHGGKDWNEILRKRKDGPGPEQTQAFGRPRPGQAHAAATESAAGANKQNAGAQPAREAAALPDPARQSRRQSSGNQDGSPVKGAFADRRPRQETEPQAEAAPNRHRRESGQ